MGSMVMIVSQVTAGKWVGGETWLQTWLWHAFGVIWSDLLMGGPHVNPAVSLGMWALGKISMTGFLGRSCAQILGCVVAFPICQEASMALSLRPLQGPTLDPAVSFPLAVQHEALATFFLLVSIFLFNFELPVRRVYFAKQGLMALVIRILIELCGAAGPAMNPALAFGWATYDAFENQGVYALPGSVEHYLCYWAAPFASSLLAAALYAVHSGTPFFGNRLWSKSDTALLG